MAAEGFYRFEAKVISRGAGSSTARASAYRSGGTVTAAAAYRAGDRITNEQTGQVHDFSNKRGVAGSEIMLPENAPHWMRDRQKLWNAVEQIETRSNAQLARDFVISIPKELNPAQRVEVVREFVKEAFVAKGIPADVAWHSPDRADKHNHHAHVMIPFRTVSGLGFSEKKIRTQVSGPPFEAWKKELQGFRMQWAEIANRHLERAGLDIRIDHRSLKDRGIDRVPQPKMGKLATHVIEKEGRASKAGEDRRHVAELNNSMAAAKAEHARAVTERADVVDLMAERAKRDPAYLETAMKAQADELLAKTVAGYESLNVDERAALRRQLLDREAQRADDERDPAKVRQREREQDAELNSAAARWSIALGENYDIRDPYGSLARAAGAEHAAFIRQQETLKQEAVRETDPLKKQLLENRRMIESADHMAQGTERLSGINAALGGVRLETVNNRIEAEQLARRGQQEREAGAVNGERVSNYALEAIRDHAKAEFWQAEAKTQREARGQLMEQLRTQEAQQIADQQTKQQAKDEAEQSRQAEQRHRNETRDQAEQARQADQKIRNETKDRADQLRLAELEDRQATRELAKQRAAEKAAKEQSNAQPVQPTAPQPQPTPQASRAVAAQFDVPAASAPVQPRQPEQGKGQERKPEAVPQQRQPTAAPFYQGNSEAARLLNEARAAGEARTREERRAQLAQERHTSGRETADRPTAPATPQQPAQRPPETAQQPAAQQQAEQRRSPPTGPSKPPAAGERQPPEQRPAERRPPPQPSQNPAQMSQAMSSQFSAPPERQTSDSQAKQQREQSDAQQQRASREAGKEMTDARRQQIAARHDRENQAAAQQAEAAQRDGRGKDGRTR